MCNHPIGGAVFASFKENNLQVRGVKIPCNSWECPDCAKRKSIILGNRVKNGFQFERVRLLTVTYSGTKTLDSAIAGLMYSWNRLRGELVRRFGLTKFFWALEGGSKNGRPHLHILINCYIKQRSLSRLASRCGFGSVVDIRAVRDNGGFGYVFKYLSKGLGSKALLYALKARRGRRYGTSRNITAVRSSDTGKVCLEFLKSDFAEETMNEEATLYANGLCKQIFTDVKTPEARTFQGESLWDKEGTEEVLGWLKIGGFGRRELLLSLTSTAPGLQAKWASVEAGRSGAIDDEDLGPLA